MAVDDSGKSFIKRCLQLKLWLVVYLAIISIPAVAKTTERDVFFAGVSFLGSYAMVEANYPAGLKLNNPSQVGRDNTLDNRFLTYLQAQPPVHYQLNTGLANLRRSESVVVSLAIESEKISQEVIGRNRKIIFEVGAQLLFMDFSNMTLLANYPIELAINHIVPADISLQDDTFNGMEALYFGQDGASGLLQKAAQLAQQVQPFAQQRIRFQVASVSTHEQAKAWFPPSLTEAQFNQHIGQTFTAQLSSQYGLAVLPFVKGYAVGNKMAGRFANGDVYNLTLPEPDYEFVILVRDFKKVEQDSNYLFGARVGLKFSHRATGRDYINGFYHLAVPKLGSENISEADDWSPSEDAVESLLSQWIQQLSSPSEEWHKIHASNKASFNEFNQKKELFNGE
ncbi:hypothetical protein [Alteromonas sp. AMM-1]|uniref:hypothetical protein n=1 Tax=Alteromonas sp. AMM-1 TaxID=3394233 RepID=UPI0039A5AADF